MEYENITTLHCRFLFTTLVLPFLRPQRALHSILTSRLIIKRAQGGDGWTRTPRLLNKRGFQEHRLRE